jgi:hypothetical protein
VVFLGSPGFIAVNRVQAVQNQAQKSDPTVKVDVKAQLSLSETVTSLDLTLTLANKSNSKVVSSYDFPNLWKVTALRSLTVVGKVVEVKSKISAQDLSLDFASKPLKPGQTAVIRLVAQSSIIRKLGQQYSLTHLELNKYGIDQSISIGAYTVKYPEHWGQPILNVASDRYRLATTSGQTSIVFNEIYKTAIVWRPIANIQVEYDYSLPRLAEGVSGGSVYLKPMLRQSDTQRWELTNPQSLSTIYRDESGNVFGGVNSSTVGQIKHTINLKLDGSRPSTAVENSTVHYARIPLSSKLEQELQKLPKADTRKLSTTEIEQQISTIISVLDKQYKVSNLDFAELSVSERGLEGKSTINYGEYLVLLWEGLQYIGVDNKIVLAQSLVAQEKLKFLIEICSERCSYYSSERNLLNYESRLDSFPYIQIGAFSGINYLMLEKMRQIDTLLPAKITPTTSGATTTGESVSGVNIKLEIPTEVFNFNNFLADIKIDNNSTETIFLQELQVEQNTFPIIDNSLAGLHQGVLPGQTKSFQIKNVFIPRLFFGDRNRVSANVALVYFANSEYKKFATTQSILVKQNYFFWALILIGIISAIVSTTLIVRLYKQNRLLVLGAYWQLRRKVSEFGWSISSKFRRK